VATAMPETTRIVPGAARAAKPQVRTAERRTAILEAATAVFGARGYNSGSLVEIAERVGMTHAGILHHFGSKEQLLLAVLAHRDAADLERIDDHENPVGAAYLDHLVHTAHYGNERVSAIKAHAVLSAESVTGNHPAQRFFRERFSGQRSRVADDLGLAVGADADDPRVVVAASAIVAVTDGLQVQWLLDPVHVDMPGAVQLVIDAIVENLRRTVGERR
jgi:AcrR family transcriptional regulator